MLLSTLLPEFKLPSCCSTSDQYGERFRPIGRDYLQHGTTNKSTRKRPESNSLHRPLLKRNLTLSSSPLALVGTKVSYIESLDYEINENDLFKHDWRSRSQTQVLQYIFLKWLLAFLVGLLTGVIATLINLAIENIAGYKLLAVVHYIDKKRSFHQLFNI